MLLHISSSFGPIRKFMFELFNIIFIIEIRRKRHQSDKIKQNLIANIHKQIIK